MLDWDFIRDEKTDRGYGKHGIIKPIGGIEWPLHR
jgi:hypothetical protein